MELLQKQELFSSLEEKQLREIASLSRFYNFEKNQLIYEQGQPGDEMFIIQSGEVIILQHEADGNKESVVAQYIAGEAFGELDLLDDLPHMQSARAEKKARVLIFPQRGTRFKDITANRSAIFASVLCNFIIFLAHRIRGANQLISEKSTVINELKKQTYEDKLSGLYNKAYLKDEAPLLLKQNGNSALLVMIKPDNFKAFNDQYGHETGDKLIRFIGVNLNEILSPDSLLLRFQGNAFAYLFFNFKEKDFLASLIELHQNLSSLPVNNLIKNCQLKLQFSMGLHLVTDKDNLIEAAEAAQQACLLSRKLGGCRIIDQHDQVIYTAKEEST